MKKTIDIPEIESTITVDLLTNEEGTHTVNLSVLLEKGHTLTHSVQFDDTTGGGSSYDE